MRPGRLLTWMFFVFWVAYNAEAVDRFVDVGGADVGDCSNMMSPCASLTYAVLISSSGDTIHMAAGTYTESGIVVGKNLVIQGTSAGSCVLQGAATEGSAPNRVLQFTAGTTNTVQDLTIRHGQAMPGNSGGPTGGTGRDGGGIKNQGTLFMEHCVVANNRAGAGGNGVGQGGNGGGGGGISNFGLLTLQHCSVVSNRAGTGADNDMIAGDGGSGGGLYSTISSVQPKVFLYDTMLGYNQAGQGGDSGSGTAGEGGSGGGAYMLVGDLFVYDSTVLLNRAGVGGNSGAGAGGLGGQAGGVFHFNILFVQNATITGNQAGAGGSSILGLTGGDGGDGGGVFSRLGSCTLTNSTISYNVAGLGGSGATVPGKGGSGGGVYNQASIVNAWNTTISGNAAGDGANAISPVSPAADGGEGGGYWSANKGFFYSCTIAYNETGEGGTGAPAGMDGEGGGCFGDSGFDTFLYNTILYENTAHSGSGPDCIPSINSGGFNYIRSNSGCTVLGNGTGVIVNMPTVLGVLQNNGGPTFTHALSPASLMTDAGDPFFVTPSYSDQRVSFARVESNRVDIGAYELGDATNDNDMDMIPDSWEVTHNLDPNDATGDHGKTGNPDMDPDKNFAEYVADTDPHDPLQYWYINDMDQPSSGTTIFISSSARQYTLQYHDTLDGTMWQNVAGQVDVPGVGGLMMLDDAGGATIRNYRLLVEVP